jgi:hypothetical protein
MHSPPSWVLPEVLRKASVNSIRPWGVCEASGEKEAPAPPAGDCEDDTEYRDPRFAVV